MLWLTVLLCLLRMISSVGFNLLLFVFVSFWSLCFIILFIVLWLALLLCLLIGCCCLISWGCFVGYLGWRGLCSCCSFVLFV